MGSLKHPHTRQGQKKIVLVLWLLIGHKQSTLNSSCSSLASTATIIIYTIAHNSKSTLRDSQLTSLPKAKSVTASYLNILQQ